MSRLLALMQNQVEDLVQKGVPAAFLGSSLSKKKEACVLRRLIDCQLRVLYRSPEKLVPGRHQRQDCLEAVHQLYTRGLFQLLLVDEAYCVSQWGGDFRPAFQKLGNVRDMFPAVPVLALTASAAPSVRSDVCQSLRMTTPIMIVESCWRSNLQIECKDDLPLATKIASIVALAQDLGGCGIVYVNARATATTVVSRLREAGAFADAYHAGLTAAQRTVVVANLQNGSCPLVVATVAFGMGIDQSNVNYVVHWEVPSCIPRFYQEIGRAGRLGQPARSVMWRSAGGIARLKARALSDADLAEVNEIVSLAYDDACCALACVGVRWRALACVGVRWRALACVVFCH